MHLLVVFSGTFESRCLPSCAYFCEFYPQTLTGFHPKQANIQVTRFPNTWSSHMSHTDLNLATTAVCVVNLLKYKYTMYSMLDTQLYSL